MAIELSALEARDVAEVAALSVRCFPPGNAWTEEELLRELARSSAEVWIARGEERVVGFVIAWFGDPRFGEGGEIVTLAADPSARRRGVGRALVERVQTSARERFVRSLTLEVRRDNAAARGLYAASGFVEIDVRRRYYADGEDALVMGWDPPAPGTTPAPR